MSALQSAVSRLERLPYQLNTLPYSNGQVTALTHHIPWFLRGPAEALIGEHCYKVLVYDFNITEVDCLKYALSKGLGFGIVVGGSTLKVPQVSASSLK